MTSFSDVSETSHFKTVELLHWYYLFTYHISLRNKIIELCLCIKH